MIPEIYKGREQTWAKHEVLRKYLQAWAAVTGAGYQDLAYIDCFAGPWESQAEDYSDTSFGIASRVLRAAKAQLASRHKSPTIRCLFIEKKPERFQELHTFTAAIQDIQATAENWDFTDRIQDIVSWAKRKKRSISFFFIDPTGWSELQIDNISPILQVTPGEVLINLMTLWITRFLDDESKNWDKWIGPKAAKELAEVPVDQRETELVRIFGDQVKAAGGFSYLCTWPILCGDRDYFHYYLVYATRSPKGVEVFKNVERALWPVMGEAWAQAQEERRVEHSRQDVLFKGARHRTSRLATFQQRNSDLARREVQSLLQEGRSVLYDDVWSTCMQHAGVLERELKEWISSWQSSGLLDVHGLTERIRVPSREKGITLKWKK